MNYTFDELQEGITKLIQSEVEKYSPGVFSTFEEHTTFDSFGLNSLSRVELITKIEVTFLVSLKIDAAFEFVTIHSLANYVWEFAASANDSSLQSARA